MSIPHASALIHESRSGVHVVFYSKSSSFSEVTPIAVKHWMKNIAVKEPRWSFFRRFPSVSFTPSSPNL